MLLTFTLGQITFTPNSLVLLLMIGVLLSFRSLPSLLEQTRHLLQRKPFRFQPILLLSLIFLLIGFIASLAPSLYWDELHYHLTVPKFYLSKAQLLPPYHLLYGFFPQGMEMLFSFFLSFFPDGGGTASLHFLFLLLLYALLCDTLSSLSSLHKYFLGFVLISTPAFFSYAVFAYVDLAFTFYLVAGILLFSKKRYLASLFFLGTASAIKYTGLPFFALGFLLILSKRLAAREKASACLWGILPFIPYLLRNVLDTGNPFYPFLANIFGGIGLTASSSSALAKSIMHFGGRGKSLSSFLLSPFWLTFSGENYAGFIGGFYLLTLPLFVKHLPKTRLSQLSLALFLFWFFTSQQTRFLLPALFFFLAGFRPEMFFELRRSQNILFFFLLLQGLLFALRFIGINQLRIDTSLQRVPVSIYLKTLETYPSIQWLNQQTTVKRVWMANDNRAFFLDKPFFVTNNLIHYDSHLPSATRIQSLRGKGISHILITRSLCANTLDLCQALVKDEQKGYLSRERVDPYTAIWRIERRRK